MKLSNLLILFLLFISSNLFSQAHNFRCLENEVYSIGCTTCDNSRTGKMITGMEVDIDGRKTELYNPIIAKYTTTTVTLIDYKFTTVTIKLASTYFASITDLLNAVKVCSDIGFSAGIDTLTYTNDTLKISFKNDSIAAYKVKIGDEQYIDTATYASDTLKLSLYNDKKAQTKIYIPAGGGGTDDQKIDTFEINSNNLRISLESDGEIYKSVNLSPYLDNTDAQKIDTFSISNDTIRLSLEGDSEKYKSLSLNEYRQKIDTFSYSSDTLRIGLSNDSSLYKKVYIPQITDTDDQTVDTFDISSNVLRLSLQGDNQAFKSVSLSGYLDNTDAQTLSWVSGSGNLTILGGNTVNLDGRYLLTEVDGSTTNEIQTLSATAGKGTLNLSLGGGSVTLNDSSSTNELQTIDSFNITTNQLRLSLSQDAPTYTVNLNPYLDNTDNQTLSIRAGKGTIDLTNSTSITLADSSATNEAWTIDGDDADTEVISNQTVKFEGAGIITTDYVPASDKIIITATEVDGSTSNELQNLSYGSKSGSDVPVNISSGAGINLTQGTNIFLDRVASNYLTIEGRTTIDTFSYSSDTLKISLTNDLEAAKKIYIPSGGATTNNIVTNGNIITSTVNGVADTTLAIRTVSNTSSTNSLSTTINGVTGSNVNIINSNSNSISGNIFTGSVNGVSDTSLIIGTNLITFSNGVLTSNVNGITDTSLINTVATTNVLSLSGNTMTSNVNGVSDTSLVIGTVNANLLGNSITVNVNGVTDTVLVIGQHTLTSSANSMTNVENGLTASANIINSNALSSSTNTITSTINGVANSGTGTIINTNVLNLSGNTLTETINGVADTSLVIGTNTLNLAGNEITTNVNGKTDTTLVIGVNTLNLSGNQITTNVNGKTDTTLVIGTVSNTSSVNNLSTSVNGVTGSNVTIINSNVSNLSGNTITNTINGVSDTVLVIGQHTLTSSANSMTNVENGLSASANIVNSISNTSSTNSLSTTVNGVTGSNVNIINSNVIGFSNSVLTSTINGVSDTALINISGGTSKGWNGLRYSNDTIFRGSNSSTLDNGSKLRFNTYNYMDTYFDSYINSTGGATLPTLHLKANNDVWFGAQDTTTAGTAYAANKPVLYFRYSSDGALNFGLNTTSNINRLGAGAVNFGGTGEAKGDYSFNSGFTGIANSTYAINLGANGQAKTGTYAFNSAGYGISSGFSSISMGYNSTVSNDYAFNSGRSSSVTGYEAANFGAVGTVSGQGAKNFGYSGQVSGTQALGFKENNVTTANQAFNGSYYTYARAYGVSRFGYLGIDFTSQNANNWVSTDILFTVDNGKNDTTRSCALTMNARGWTQHRDLGTTQIKVVDSLAKPKAVLEIVSTTSGMIPAGGTKAQRDAIFNDATQAANFTPTYTKGWVNSAGGSIMDQCGMQFQTTNETGGSSLYALRWNGTIYVWHQIY